MRACFDDLFAFSYGLCHLRLYGCDDEEPVAVVVQLESNPSVFTGAELLAERIAIVFGRSRFRLYVFALPQKEWSEVLMEAGDRRADFRSVEQAEIENLIGEPVAMPEAEDFTARAVGGRRHPMLELAPPTEGSGNLLDDLHVVAVADLPWADNPSRCSHADRFQVVRGLYESGYESDPAAGAHFFLSLGEDDFAACSFHRGDWVKIAAEAIDLFGKLHPESTFEQIYGAVERRFPEGSEQEALLSLFTHPIIWHRPATGITNGQHRVCALKAAGAPFCPVKITGEPPEELVAGDQRRRAQSTLAQYWARQLGGELSQPGSAASSREELA